VAIDWEGVRDDFEATEISVAGLAAKYRCAESSVRRKARKEGWRRPPSSKANGVSGHCHGPLGEDLTLWREVRKKLIKGLKNKDAKVGLEEVKVAKMAGELIPNVIEGERHARGLDGEASERCDETSEIVAEMERLTVPPGPDPALEGE